MPDLCCAEVHSEFLNGKRFFSIHDSNRQRSKLLTGHLHLQKKKDKKSSSELTLRPTVTVFVRFPATTPNCSSYIGVKLMALSDGFSFSRAYTGHRYTQWL